MGHSQTDKAQTHARIVEIAARLFREKGVEGVGVADIMKEAGLTVGGFYKHFESRDALVTEALGSALGMWQDRIDAAPEGGVPVTLAALLTSYLSPAHRDNPGHGCVIAAVGSDIARSTPATRDLCTQAVKANLDVIAARIEGAERNRAAERAQAILTYSAMVGAVSLARAIDDEPLSLEILATVEGALKELSKAHREPDART